MPDSVKTMNRPPLIFHILYGLLILAKPWYPFLTGKLDRQPGLKGTMDPRLMKTTIDAPEKSPIWLHAVSVGEVEAALPIARRIIEIYGPERLLMTVTTKEGLTVAQTKLEGLKFIQFYPMDIPGVIEKFLNHFKPSVYICMETELWPVLMNSLIKRGIPIVLANGRISDRLKDTPVFMRSLYRWMFRSFNWIGLQTDEDLNRLLNFTAKCENAEVIGNTKFDLPEPDSDPGMLLTLRKENGLGEGSIIVFGSTHPGEEIIIAKVFKSIKDKIPGLRMILAPRHIKRADEIIEILERAKISFNMRSETKLGSVKNKNADCLLLDTVGELTRMYALGDIAFVGGSLIKRGGHNLLEPAAAGIPVLHGSNMDNFRAITVFLHNAKAAVMVENESELEMKILELLNNPSALNEMKSNARTAYEKGRGASDRVVEKIKELA